MDIKLEKWACSGFRCPDMTIDLVAGDHVPRVALIQMPNGTGKTTTLTLLKATLTGTASEWTPTQLQEIRRAGSSVGKFSVDLRINERPLKLELTCDFESGAVSYTTTSPEVGGFNKGWAPPAAVRRFLTRRFVDLFVFDGELAASLLDARETKAEEAIETLCQLDLLDSVSADCEAVWERETRSGAKNEKGLARYKNIEGKLVLRLDLLRKNVDSMRQELAATTKRIEDLNAQVKRLVEQNGRNRELWHEKNGLKLEKEQALSDELRMLMAHMRRPEALCPDFGGSLQTLKASLDKVKLPDSTSRQFFLELSKEPLCICGRPIGHEQKETILGRAEEFLGEELAGVLNAFKQEVDLLEPQSRSLELQKSSEKISELRHAIATLISEMTAIEKLSLAAAGEDPESYRQELIRYESKAQELTDQLEVLTGTAAAKDTAMLTSPTEVDDLFEVAAVQRQLKLVREEISRINGTLELRQRLDLLKEICKGARDTAKLMLKKTILERANHRLQQVLKGDPIQIKDIDRSLVLDGRSSGSAGQNLAIGYTFLAQALHKGSHEFPLVVDSPAGPLDHDVRREVASMVPGLCNQFVAFTISTEREAFLEPLEASAEGDVKYITAFRNSPGNAYLMARLPPDHVTNGQSSVVEGRDFFVQFAVKEE
ncbi:hypothetical protein [Ramlibacter rhizophilus]|uniref:Rad50/SbcC-type AAA domain-containing protein n=1 Tax=Ramlibacter rhizophilus TaxID=1781167 RepID=A0A4Z0BZF0_9BURK|nr:hypothetical protein [Ramlibacter rhizophilus]TFZ03385.1 hypothetical protein EZ242_05745 [Ramlibacter rhizophilus]